MSYDVTEKRGNIRIVAYVSSWKFLLLNTTNGIDNLCVLFTFIDINILFLILYK